MTSDETIRKVAGVIDGILSADPQVAREMFGDEPDRIARALAEEGLLAPAPLREEWATYDPDDTVMWGRAHFRADSEDEARRKAHGFGYVVHRRYVTEWEEA